MTALSTFTDRTRTFFLRPPTWSGCAWVLLTTAMAVALSITSAVTSAALGRPVSATQYAHLLQASPALVVMLAPLAHELFFRGWLLQQLRSRMRTWTAMLLSAFAFALVSRVLFRIEPFGNIAAGVALGLSAAVLFVITRSIWAAILLHALHNAALMALVWAFQDHLRPRLTGEVPVSLGAAVVLEGVLVLLWALVLNVAWKRRADSAAP